MSFPIRHETHTLEQKSEIFLLRKLPQEWVPNKPQHDYGADFQIGIAEDREMRGLELIVQLKASKKSSGHKDSEKISLNVSTYKYLRNLLTVVMLIKYVEELDEAYWVFLRDIAKPKDEAQKSFTVNIPKANTLSTIDWGFIASIVRQITDLKLGAING